MLCGLCEDLSSRVKGLTLSPKPEIADRNLYGCQSRPRSKHRREIAVRQHDSRGLLEQTKSADRLAVSLAGVRDEPGSVETFGKSHERRYELHQAGLNKVSRSSLYLWRSRSVFKIAICNFRKLPSVIFELFFYLVAESRQRWARSFIMDKSLPHKIPPQLGQNGRQIFRQPFALAWWQRLYGLFNLSNGTHKADRTL